MSRSRDRRVSTVIVRGDDATPTVELPAASAARPARVDWADAAKGACIVLVVLWHVIMKHYLQIDWRITAPIPGAWGRFSEQLLPLRMPLFFTISGLFAAGALGRPWRVLARSKVAKFLYLYALWLLIHTALLALAPGFATDRATDLLELLGQLTITPSNLWYLYALALYFAFAKAVRRLPAFVVLGAAFLLSATAAAGLLDVPGNRGGVYQNLVFFVAGIYGKRVVERMAGTATWLRLAAVAAAFGGVLAAIAVADAKAWFGLWPATGFVAVTFGVTAAGLLTRWRAATAALAGIGRQTLPVYVMHMPLLALLHVVLVGQLSAADGTWQLVVAIAEPPALTALLVWLCLVLHRGLRAPWLFDLPAARRAPAHRRTGG